MRRLGNGGFRAYLWNGSAADIEHPEGSPARGERSESNLVGMRSRFRDRAFVSNGRCDLREVSSLSAVALAKEGGHIT